MKIIKKKFHRKIVLHSVCMLKLCLDITNEENNKAITFSFWNHRSDNNLYNTSYKTQTHYDFI